MIQIQEWEKTRKIMIVDEEHHGTVQVEIPKPGKYKDEYYKHADCAIFNLWVDEPYRKQGVARMLIETAEREAKKLGCKKVQLEWNIKESDDFVIDWYSRIGYDEKEFGRGSSLLVKEL